MCRIDGYLCKCAAIERWGTNRFGGSMFPGTIRVAVLRFLWAPGPPVPDQMPHLMWPQQLYDVIFWSPNGWSLRDYWQRVTFGLMDLQFDLDNVVWWRLDDRDQASLMHDRGGIMAACRQAAEEGGHSLAGYDRVVAFVHAPPCDAGALSEFGDVVFDQNKTLEELQHEIGHLLGFQHAWGPQGVYKDPYCVMGETGPFDHSIPPAPEAAGVTMLKPFWRSGRRVSAASLYRLFSSPSLGGRGGIASGVGAAGYFDVYVFHGQLGQSIWLTAL